MDGIRLIGVIFGTWKGLADNPVVAVVGTELGIKLGRKEMYTSDGTAVGFCGEFTGPVPALGTGEETPEVKVEVVVIVVVGSMDGKSVRPLRSSPSGSKVGLDVDNNVGLLVVGDDGWLALPSIVGRSDINAVGTNEAVVSVTAVAAVVVVDSMVGICVKPEFSEELGILVAVSSKIDGNVVRSVSKAVVPGVGAKDKTTEAAEGEYDVSG